ncbi:MAG: methyltransferase domain-containing protein [Chloroflexi bacterium]|nr:methyltransferase domain-containing protein [Chloroflexota bacterium]
MDIKRTLAQARRLLQFDPEERARHDYAHVFLKGLRDVQELSPRPLKEARVLILGCGYTYPEVILYNPRVRFVAGLDVLNAFYRDGWLARYRDILQREGHPLQAAFKTAVERYKFARYYTLLEDISGVRVEHERYVLHTYDGYHMPFPDDYFDVVMSNAVLEHVEDMPRLVEELARVTRPGGISYHLWHNYYSLSGGHVHPSIYRAEPWGHVRGVYPTSGLNRLRPEEIRAFFSARFLPLSLYHVDAKHAKQELDPDYEPEGAELLTPELRAELAEYPEDLLLTRAFLLIARLTTQT